MYLVRFPSARVERELQRLPPGDRVRMVMRLQQLQRDPRPRGVVPLRPNVYRLRMGGYRILYEVDDAARQIILGRIERRRERTYREGEELF